jgi:hypothetical protein
MSREEIIAANPIVDFVCNRGHELKRAGKNFVTNASPVAQHKRGHRPVMIYPENNSWFDHDLKLGGSVIDWVMLERGCDAGQAMRELSGDNGAPEIVATYDYRDEGGNLIFQCVRSKPKDFWQRRPDGKGGWINNLQGVRRVLYRLPEIISAQSVCVPEGEKDVDNLTKLGFVATTNPLGAGKWRDEYSETLREKNVIVFGDVGDEDEAGERHTAKVLESLMGRAKSIKHVVLPNGFHDVSDYIATLPPKTAADTIRKLIEETPEIKPDTSRVAVQSTCRPLRVEAPKTHIHFKQWQEVISANFPAYARPAEICASVIVQLLLNDVSNPFALALVDVPSSGKTITLNFFDVPDLAYTTDNFTPASFVSHASNVKREELGNVDMLPRIRYRTLIVRDLAPIFGVKEDELLKTIGILTRALDGEGLETDSGVHGKRGYKGDWLFMLLAGTTPIPPRVFKVMGTLGSRLFFLALHSKAKSHDELISQNRGTARREKERTCREATDSFLRTLWAANSSGMKWDKDGDDEDCLRVIARCAELLAALRGTIQMWQSEHDGSVSHSVPIVEQPDRINCLLYNLARGHALVCGRTQLAIADLAPVLEVTFDSAPTIRSKIFRELVENDGALQTSEVEKLLRCSKPTALKEMEALAVLGVGEKAETDPQYGRPEHELQLAEKFLWFATDECKGMRWP